MRLSGRGAFFVRKSAIGIVNRIFIPKNAFGLPNRKKNAFGLRNRKKNAFGLYNRKKKCVWTAQSPKEMRLSCTLVKSPGAFCWRCISVVIFAASNRILIALHFWITFFDISNRIFFNIAFSIAFLTSSNRIFQNIAFSIAFSYSSNHIFSINAFSIAFFGSHLV